MSHITHIIQKHLNAIIILAFICVATQTNGQDTLAGNYPLLTIKSGNHVIKNVVTVKGRLDIEAGARIELIETGVIVCEGAVNLKGDLNNKIEIFGKSNVEGVGMVIKGLDSNSNSTIDIKYTTFKNLQLPIFFDFGWKRAGVNISDNYFINNIGKVSVIQVLNPPFNFNIDSSYIDFEVKNNVFTGNNAALYFEDLKSDHINYEISNNTIVGNNVYGFKNYNISTNVLYGRVDQLFSRFNPKIERNSFAFNYLVDNITDTIVHLANFGVYGTDKTIDFKNNYLGSTNKAVIQKSIYDQTLNYNAPKVEFEPYLSTPSESNPSHVYEINNLDNSFLPDTIIIKDPLKGLVLKSNTSLNFSKARFGYTYFKDDSSLNIVDTTLTYDLQPNGNSTKLTITKNVNAAKKIGYYNIGDIIDAKGGYVPEVKLGYIAYLNDLRRRKLIAEFLKDKKKEDSLIMPPPPADSIKNQFQKIEAPLKSRLEFGLYSGLAIFNGTISQSSLISNDKNLYNGFNINYTIFSNLSASMTISSFKLSNSDANSNNNEQQARGMSFVTSMLGVSTSFNYDFVDNRLYTKARRIRPSIGVGLDVNSFSPSGIYNGVEYKLQPLGTGGQLIDSTKKAYSNIALGYFFNFKIKYQINRFNSIGLHMSIHKSLSDYLDDVGPDLYPSTDKIVNSKIENKDAAIYFSNPTSRNFVGQYRNSPNNAKDGYINFGIFYSRRLFK
jgi:hypothetical protein